MKINETLRPVTKIVLSLLFSLSNNAQACNNSHEKIPAETIDVSDLKPGNSKIVVWGHLPVALIKKPNRSQSLDITSPKPGAIATTTSSLDCFVGENGKQISARSPEEISVLILLTPTGCSPSIIMEPSKAPTPEARSIVESSGGLIYDTCTGDMFDLNGMTIERSSSNMLAPTHTVSKNQTVVLGKSAN